MLPPSLHLHLTDILLSAYSPFSLSPWDVLLVAFPFSLSEPAKHSLKSAYPGNWPVVFFPEYFLPRTVPGLKPWHLICMEDKFTKNWFLWWLRKISLIYFRVKNRFLVTLLTTSSKTVCSWKTFLYSLYLFICPLIYRCVLIFCF